MSILKFLKIFYDAASIYKKDIIARLTWIQGEDQVKN
jgi:hypothetical protein